MSNVIITGGCGFLASGLIKHLIKDDSINKIICIDNFITSSKSSFLEFKKYYDTDNQVILYNCDISKANLMDLLLLDISQTHNINSIDEIYHLASIASPVMYKKYPLETLDCGYIGTKIILEIARKFNSKVLFSSTSEVYGDAVVSPQDEGYLGNVNSFGARACYDESKRVAEALCYTYQQQYNLDIKVARIFNTYGPHMLLDDGRIITEVIKNLMNKTTLTIYGTGEQTRSCVFIDNTVDMLVRLMASNCNIPVNIGNNIELTVNEIVDTIEKVYQKHFDKKCKLERNYVELTQNDPLKRCPCLKRNKEILGETKYTSFEDGILKTIKYFVDN